MKRLFVIVAAGLLLSACGGSSPEDCVRECWRNIDKGSYKKAVEKFDVTADEEPVFREMFAEQGAVVKAAGGVEKIEVVSFDSAVDTASVEAAVTFGNGQTVTETYKLVLKEGDWKITW